MMVHNERITINELVTKEAVIGIVTDKGTSIPIPPEIVRNYGGLDDWVDMIGHEFDIEIAIEGGSAKVIALGYISPDDDC